MINIIKDIQNFLGVTEKEGGMILEKVLVGGECSKDTQEDWLKARFKANCIFIDTTEYAQMCVNALKSLWKTAATDFGSSRQRDMGQLWADTTRGYLGEVAFRKFLKQKFNIESDLDHEEGELKDFLASDLKVVKTSSDKNFRKPNLNISIKTTKWNGVWLDIPGNQFSHSDIFVLVKVGVSRDHLFAFFKEISVFKDKILKKGVEVGSLNEQQAQKIYDELPSFKNVPAYICGFVEKDTVYKDLPYGGKKGRKNYTIESWNGRLNDDDMQKIKEIEGVSGSIKFQGIGDFSHNGYVFNTGNFKWKEEDWKRVLSRI
jgi:hypothetical protein